VVEKDIGAEDAGEKSPLVFHSFKLYEKQSGNV
jgi:hypothetical protein